MALLSLGTASAGVNILSGVGKIFGGLFGSSKPKRRALLGSIMTGAGGRLVAVENPATPGSKPVLQAIADKVNAQLEAQGRRIKPGFWTGWAVLTNAGAVGDLPLHVQAVSGSARAGAFANVRPGGFQAKFSSIDQAAQTLASVALSSGSVPAPDRAAPAPSTAAKAAPAPRAARASPALPAPVAPAPAVVVISPASVASSKPPPLELVAVVLGAAAWVVARKL